MFHVKQKVKASLPLCYSMKNYEIPKLQEERIELEIYIKNDFPIILEQ